MQLMKQIHYWIIVVSQMNEQDVTLKNELNNQPLFV